MRYVAFAAQVLLGVTFAVAAIGKLRDLDEFRQSLYRLVPAPLAWLVPRGALAAVAVPAGELAIAVGLVVPYTSKISAVGGLLAMLGFTVTVGLALRRGDRAPCHCFGASPRRLGVRQLVRNIVLTVIAVLCLGDGSANVAGLAVAGFVGLVGALLVVRADDILDLFVAGPARVA